LSGTPPHPKLAIRDLSKSYAAGVALEPTSLDVADGEFLTLLGPSGSGKTTLLMMVAGLTMPSGGTIRVNGRDITTRPAYQRDIGVVFQNYALFPHLSVFENIAFPLRMRKLGGAAMEKAVREALEVVQLPHLAERFPRELSGGQQQRIAFARAIVFKPSLVLMDEPLGALDKKLRDELKLEIRKLHRELGMTVVYVTHDQDEAMMLSDRICLMNNARIEQIGTPSALYERPATIFAATFLGESNIIEAEILPDGLRIGGTVLPTAYRDQLPSRSRSCPVLIRPERVSISSPDERRASLAGRIRSVLDLGGTRRVTIELCDGRHLDMTCLGGGIRPEPGCEITVSIDPADIVPLGGRG